MGAEMDTMGWSLAGRRRAGLAMAALAAAGWSAGVAGCREGTAQNPGPSPTAIPTPSPTPTPIPIPTPIPTPTPIPIPIPTPIPIPIPTPIPTALAGWTPWPVAPAGCAIWIPDSARTLASLGELTWRACPFAPAGCTALGATWAARTGWGFGGRLSAASSATASSAASSGNRTYLAFTRQVQAGLWETVILGGPRAPVAGPSSGPGSVSGSPDGPALVPVAAWRQQLWEAGCVLGSPSLTVDDGEVTAALPILRADAQAAPLVVLGAPESITQAPRVEAFGAAGAEVLARDVALRRGELLVVWEHAGRFALRDLASKETFRPSPPLPEAALLEATPITTGGDNDDNDGNNDGKAAAAAAGVAAVFTAWTGERGSVWLADRRGVTSPLLVDARHSYDRFASDGERAVWLRSTGREDPGTFARVELWTGRLAGHAGDRGSGNGDGHGNRLTAQRLLRTLPAGALPLVSIGEGWAALWTPPPSAPSASSASSAPSSASSPSSARPSASPQLLLVRLSDGALRHLPTAAALVWDGGSGGLAIAGGAVWARASLRGRAGNDHRLIARFSLDALPKGDPR